MKVISSPDWFEPETLSYIADFFCAERMDEDSFLLHVESAEEYSSTFIDERPGKDSFVFHDKAPPRYLISPDLQKIWSKAKKRFPDDPAKGQIELFRMIEFSFRQSEDNWMTKAQAEKKRDQILRTIDKLEKLWAEIPSNFMTKVDNSQDLLRADEIVERIPGIAEARAFIDGLEYTEQVHGYQTEGYKAERLHFERELSSEFNTATGKLMREDVATIASTIYGKTVSRTDVIRTTKGLQDTSAEDNEFIRSIINELDTPPNK